MFQRGGMRSVAEGGRPGSVDTAVDRRHVDPLAELKRCWLFSHTSVYHVSLNAAYRRVSITQ